MRGEVTKGNIASQHRKILEYFPTRKDFVDKNQIFLRFLAFFSILYRWCKSTRLRRGFLFAGILESGRPWGKSHENVKVLRKNNAVCKKWAIRPFHTVRIASGEVVAPPRVEEDSSDPKSGMI